MVDFFFLVFLFEKLRKGGVMVAASCDVTKLQRFKACDHADQAPAVPVGPTAANQCGVTAASSDELLLSDR